VFYSVKLRKKWLFAALALGVCAAGFRPAARLIFPIAYRESVSRNARRFGIDAHLALAVIRAESNFNADATSHKMAGGLMQITEVTAFWIAKSLNEPDFQYEQIYEPERNIRFGVYYISYLLRMYQGREPLALAAYNAGFGKVDAWLADESLSPDGVTLAKIPYGETERYVRRVRLYKGVYQFLYGELDDE
jgi:soluble lytic murein transglycosylase